MGNLLHRVRALGPELKGYEPERALAALELYLAGKSVYHAAREMKVPEARLRNWVSLLGVKRTEEQVLALKQAAGRAANELETERRREALKIRQQAHRAQIDRQSGGPSALGGL